MDEAPRESSDNQIQDLDHHFSLKGISKKIFIEKP
jgi:hypothetical protein